MAAIIDKGIPGGDTGYIARMCLWLVALGGIGLLSSGYRAILCGKSGNRLFRQAAPCADGAYPDAELYRA